MTLDGRTRVLIADADSGLRRAFHERLVDSESFADCVADGKEALQKLSTASYAVVLLDLSLPVVGAERVLAGDLDRLVVLVVPCCGTARRRLEVERVDFDAFALVRLRGLLFGALLLLLPVPLTQGEDARLHANDRVRLVFLLQQRGEPGTHGDLGALADVGEKVLLDRKLGDLLVVEGLARDAQHFGCGFGERHIRLPVVSGALRPVGCRQQHCSRSRRPAHFHAAFGTFWW